MAVQAASVEQPSVWPGPGGTKRTPRVWRLAVAIAGAGSLAAGRRCMQRGLLLCDKPHALLCGHSGMLIGIRTCGMHFHHQICEHAAVILCRDTEYPYHKFCKMTWIP